MLLGPWRLCGSLRNRMCPTHNVHVLFFTILSVCERKRSRGDANEQIGLGVILMIGDGGVDGIGCLGAPKAV